MRPYLPECCFKQLIDKKCFPSTVTAKYPDLLTEIELSGAMDIPERLLMAVSLTDNDVNAIAVATLEQFLSM